MIWSSWTIDDCMRWTIWKVMSVISMAIVRLDGRQRSDDDRCTLPPIPSIATETCDCQWIWNGLESSISFTCNWTCFDRRSLYGRSTCARARTVHARILVNVSLTELQLLNALILSEWVRLSFQDYLVVMTWIRQQAYPPRMCVIAFCKSASTNIGPDESWLIDQKFCERNR